MSRRMRIVPVAASFPSNDLWAGTVVRRYGMLLYEGLPPKQWQFAPGVSRCGVPTRVLNCRGR